MEGDPRIQLIRSAIENGDYLSVCDITAITEQIGIKGKGSYYSSQDRKIIFPVPGHGEYSLSDAGVCIDGDCLPYSAGSIDRFVAQVQNL